MRAREHGADQRATPQGAALNPMAKIPFTDLDVGACFAFARNAKTATRRKVSETHTIMLPNGRKPMRVLDTEATVVHPMACPTSNLGRRRKRRSKASR